VVENTTGHFESQNAMAGIAIDVRYRMTDRLTRRRTRTISNMTGIARYTRTHNVRAGMIGVGVQETDRGMAITAFRVGDRVGAGWDVSGSRRHTSSHSAVVATAAYSGNTGVIKAAVRFQFKKSSGIVAVTAFGVRWHMKCGFTDGQVTIVTLAAISENFLMIDKGDYVKSLRGMTGLAGITGADVSQRFTRNVFKIIVVTILAI